ncbi:MAG: hypothetical protein NC548_15745 [Lachnospiraceae bacterium]|nr:hypothetical protein [Lachnospiraceae bacterium]
MNSIYFNLRRLLNVSRENKNDIRMLLTGIKMVSEMGASEISINNEYITAVVTRDYKNNIVTIDTPNYGLMFNCSDSGAMAYYALAVIENEDNDATMEDIINMFSKRGMSYKKTPNNFINKERNQYSAELHNRLVVLKMIVTQQ